MTRRVVITGLGTVNSLCSDVPGFWSALCARSQRHRQHRAVRHDRIQGAFRRRSEGLQAGSRDGSEDGARLGSLRQFALAASLSAVKDSGVEFSKEDPYRCGVIIGSGIGGLNEFEEQHTPLHARRAEQNQPVRHPENDRQRGGGQRLDSVRAGGPSTAVSTACSSAANAIGDALRAIQHEQADVMITGGSEAAITPMGLGGFTSARALSHAKRRSARGQPSVRHRPRRLRPQ